MFIRSELQCMKLVRQLVARGKHHDRDRALPLDLAADLESAFPREVDIQEQKVRSEHEDFFRHTGKVLDTGHLVPFFFEHGS